MMSWRSLMRKSWITVTTQISLTTQTSSRIQLNQLKLLSRRSKIWSLSGTSLRRCRKSSRPTWTRNGSSRIQVTWKMKSRTSSNLSRKWGAIRSATLTSVFKMRSRNGSYSSLLFLTSETPQWDRDIGTPWRRKSRRTSMLMKNSSWEMSTIWILTNMLKM